MKNPTYNYEYGIEIPKVQQPEEIKRYLFDVRVEKPEKPCGEKPWQGLVAQVDRVLMPARDCQNADHTPKTCNCGCRNPSHMPSTCTCGRSDYKLPIIYNTRYDSQSDDSKIFPVFSLPDSMMSSPSGYEIASKKIKRETKYEKKSKRRELKYPKAKAIGFKKISSKDVKALRSIDPVSQQKLTSKKSKIVTRQLKSSRKQESTCGYTYESCDPKNNNQEGCPLCYRCKCDPIVKSQSDQKFSPYDFKVPYKFVTNDEAPGTAPTNQEFDYEPPSYTGLKEADMYKKYIQQILSKYPEHMSRKLPDMRDQEQDLLKFIGELSKADKSPGKKMDDEDVRYRLMDDAMGMYKYYEKAVSAMPKSKNRKLSKKRGTVLEVLELDPNDFERGTFEIAHEENGSESQ